jgi:hypothetical protein
MEKEPNYMRGFNDGYKLAKYSPQLVDKLMPALSADIEYERGIIEGVNQLEQEKTQEQSRLDEINNIRNSKEQSQEQDLER